MSGTVQPRAFARRGSGSRARPSCARGREMRGELGGRWRAGLPSAFAAGKLGVDDGQVCLGGDSRW